MSSVVLLMVCFIGLGIVRTNTSVAQGVRTIQIDGDTVLAGRAMDARFLAVLKSVNQYAYVVVNPANGPEEVDGNDLDGDGYAGPNPNVEDFVLRAKRLGNGTTKILGFLPKIRGEAVAANYRSRTAADGIFLSGYTCVEAASAKATIQTTWPSATVVVGTSGCSGIVSINTADPAQYTLVNSSASNVVAGSQDPYAGYPTAFAPKLGIPAYFNDSASWDRLLTGAGDIGAVTINVSDLGLIRSKIRVARAAGVKVYAYVPTGYVTQSNPPAISNAASTSARVSAALTDADIDGVFLDEVRSGCSDRATAFYTPLYNQAVAAGKQLIYNPGQTAGSCFNAISSVSVNFEGTAATYGNWPASEWGRSSGSNKIWQIVHSASLAEISIVVNLAKQRNAGLIWVAPNSQWTQFPDQAYFDAVRLAVRGALGTVSSTSPSASSPTIATGVSSTTPVIAAPSASVPTNIALSNNNASVGASSNTTSTTSSTSAPTTSSATTTVLLVVTTTSRAVTNQTVGKQEVQPSRAAPTLVAAPSAANQREILSGTSLLGIPTATRSSYTARHVSYAG
jgi:hypothetical protein